MKIGTEGPNTRESIEQPSMIDIGWIAGFLEGEGCFTKGRPNIAASQVQKQPLVRLVSLVGGDLNEREERIKAESAKINGSGLQPALEVEELCLQSFR
jgi:hypothetical protein